MFKKTAVGSFVICMIISCAASDRKQATTILIEHNSYNFDAKNAQLQQSKIIEISAKSNCPDDMAEIDGDFCHDVIQNCLKLDKSIHNVNGYIKCDLFDKTQCLSKERVHMHFCMDRYEWPNQKGVKPTVMVSWNDMKKNCESVGKRLCQDHEWSLACEGPEILPYPYGYKRDDMACNIDHTQKPNFDASKSEMTKEIVSYLDQRVPSGSMDRCVSYYGVYDMTGNVDESVVNSAGKPFKSAEMGGHWVAGARNKCRPETIVHNENFKYYEIGGRCCKDIKEQ